jgi:hypothetical protein
MLGILATCNGHANARSIKATPGMARQGMASCQGKILWENQNLDVIIEP